MDDPRPPPQLAGVAGEIRRSGTKRDKYRELPGPTVKDGRLMGSLYKFSDGKWNKKSWHDRWFVLDKKTGQLSYFKNQDRASKEGISTAPAKPKDAHKARGTMDLNHSEAALLEGKMLDHKLASGAPFALYCFQVRECQGNTVGLCASNQEDYDIWVETIKVAIQRKFLDDPHFQATQRPKSQSTYQREWTQQGAYGASSGGGPPSPSHHPMGSTPPSYNALPATQQGGGNWASHDSHSDTSSDSTPGTPTTGPTSHFDETPLASASMISSMASSVPPSSPMGRGGAPDTAAASALRRRRPGGAEGEPMREHASAFEPSVGDAARHLDKKVDAGEGKSVGASHQHVPGLHPAIVLTLGGGNAGSFVVLLGFNVAWYCLRYSSAHLLWAWAVMANLALATVLFHSSRRQPLTGPGSPAVPSSRAQVTSPLQTATPQQVQTVQRQVQPPRHLVPQQQPHQQQPTPPQQQQQQQQQAPPPTQPKPASPTATPAPPSSTGKPRAGETLPRLTRDGQTQCWSDVSGETFRVRIGPNYAKNKQKALSGPAISKVVAVDMIASNPKLGRVYDKFEWPPEAQEPGCFLFIVSTMLPNYAPPKLPLGRAPGDGPSHSVVMWTIIPPATMEKVWTATSGELLLLRRFITADQQPNPESIYDRFKMIGRLANPDDVPALGGYERRLVKGWNATPVLTRPQHKIYHGKNYCEVCVDVHTFGYVGRTGLHAFGANIKDMLIDWSFVIEGHTDEELPEVILACVRLNKADKDKAPQWRFPI